MVASYDELGGTSAIGAAKALGAWHCCCLGDWTPKCAGRFLAAVPLLCLPQDISAAAMLEALYFYAIAHQQDFDVCWPRGSIAETIFQPMVERIRGQGGKVRETACFRVLGQLLLTQGAWAVGDVDELARERDGTGCRESEPRNQENVETCVGVGRPSCRAPGTQATEERPSVMNSGCRLDTRS
jgi:hypothetical protein